MPNLSVEFTAAGPLTCFRVVVERDAGKHPLIAQFGGFPIRRQRDAVISDQRPPMAYTRGTELIKRLLADACELCGRTERVEVHHIRKLADLRRPGQGQIPDWRRIMATRKRKTLVVCRRCHEAIHQGKAIEQHAPA